MSKQTAATPPAIDATELQSRLDSAMQTVQTLQVKLDAALQKNQDDAAAFVKELGEKEAEFAKTIRLLKADHEVALLTVKQEMEVDRLVQQHLAHRKSIQDAAAQVHQELEG
jgi:hypothetical protein